MCRTRTPRVEGGWGGHHPPLALFTSKQARFGDTVVGITVVLDAFAIEGKIGDTLVGISVKCLCHRRQKGYVHAADHRRVRAVVHKSTAQGGGGFHGVTPKNARSHHWTQET